MTEKEDNYEKIVFKYQSHILDEITVENMWAEIIDKPNGIYRLDSIPFYGPLIATGDEFYAEYDGTEERLTYRNTTKHSGNSIVVIVIIKKCFDKEIIRDEFKKLDCLSEGLNEAYFSMEVLKETDYSKIRNIMENYEQNGILEFAEPCLSDKHRSDLKNN
ncbi:DUF4265 domain-containing protein [Cellulophaga sp. F20128]|uniref:DUF4265 domain-containing protein n=1 Tax=Cellulophaga sp. F20128 TaxID=2926413 RepID=UPI001FF5679A|nr:DUF4265 domain-containing protein [Cellulophaga sp. F20128]MCK0158922.1 DUF4265 domain-containing protein [Cellulophaga sp. F20128]